MQNPMLTSKAYPNLSMKGCKSMILENKVAIVSGAAQGIGKAIAKKLAEEGAKVYILDYNIEQAQKTAKEFADEGLKCTAKFCDIADVKTTQTLVREIIACEEKIDILVNNAGITQKLGILEITEEDWDKVLNINLRGAFFLTQVVFENMMKHRSGSIVSIASVSAERGAKFAGINYACSKGGIVVMTKCLALNGGEYGIRANAIAPGLIRTAMADQLQFSTDSIPLGRLGTPEEVAEAALYLASDRSSYISGSIIDVNGGDLMR